MNRRQRIRLPGRFVDIALSALCAAGIIYGAIVLVGVFGDLKW